VFAEAQEEIALAMCMRRLCRSAELVKESFEGFKDKSSGLVMAYSQEG
jgi:hypothetical protein